MFKPIPIFITLILALVLSACSSDAAASGGLSGGTQLSMVGTSWQAVQIGELIPPADRPSTIYFEGQAINGNAGCNGYFGTYTLEDEKLSFSDIGSTMMFCEQSMEQESAFLSALAAVTGFRMDDKTMLLLDAEQNVLMSLIPLQHAALDETIWQLTMLNNGQQAVSSLPEGLTITAQFQEDGRVQGSAGCNNYFGEYHHDEGRSLSISALASTEMFCNEPAGVMEQEAAFLKAMEQAQRYEIRQQSLTVYGTDDEVLLQFVAQ